jgi:hypothetical protein
MVVTVEMLTDLMAKMGATAVWPVAAAAVGWVLLRKYGWPEGSPVSRTSTLPMTSSSRPNHNPNPNPKHSRRSLQSHSPSRSL